ncbi:hypothetical protein K443DRAFT_11906 [Laccaria amethystina LaAM-08-1]|uniref:Uncharacterized protein n=1 Tax=Laccaria amethystina LaAM-08-1 TaxID=1095629 RepID=A0A0C9X068_9AGAR|nr:hypothetical protein K443DRAFT_11906 [Laccaria amethystina LaAM-08-1]
MPRHWPQQANKRPSEGNDTLVRVWHVNVRVASSRWGDMRPHHHPHRGSHHTPMPTRAHHAPTSMSTHPEQRRTSAHPLVTTTLEGRRTMIAHLLGWVVTTFIIKTRQLPGGRGV